MSSTTMYIVERDGTLSEFNNYRNGHGSGPQVWSHLSFKYLDNITDPDSNWVPGKRSWVTDNEVLTELYTIVDACACGESSKMQPYEWRTLLAVADYVVLKIELLDVYAEALQTFADEYKDACKGQAFSIGEQAEDLRKVRARAAAEGWRGVCWRQTSVSDVFDAGEMTEARRGTAILQALEDTNSSLNTAQRAEVVEALAEGWEPFDSYCAYNIDIDTRHSWLEA